MGSTFQFSHNNDKMAGNSPEPGADQVSTTEDGKQDHRIIDFMNQVSKLPVGKYKVVNGKIIPQN
jgi:hypothetical protein